MGVPIEYLDVAFNLVTLPEGQAVLASMTGTGIYRIFDNLNTKKEEEQLNKIADEIVEKLFGFFNNNKRKMKPEIFNIAIRVKAKTNRLKFKTDPYTIIGDILELLHEKISDAKGFPHQEEIITALELLIAEWNGPETDPPKGFFGKFKPNRKRLTENQKSLINHGPRSKDDILSLIEIDSGSFIKFILIVSHSQDMEETETSHSELQDRKNSELSLITDDDHKLMKSGQKIFSKLYHSIKQEDEPRADMIDKSGKKTRNLILSYSLSNFPLKNTYHPFWNRTFYPTFSGRLKEIQMTNYIVKYSQEPKLGEGKNRPALLCGIGGTGARIMESLSNIYTEMLKPKPNDCGIFFFSGHGSYNVAFNDINTDLDMGINIGINIGMADDHKVFGSGVEYLSEYWKDWKDDWRDDWKDKYQEYQESNSSRFWSQFIRSNKYQDSSRLSIPDISSLIKSESSVILSSILSKILSKNLKLDLKFKDSSMFQEFKDKHLRLKEFKFQEFKNSSSKMKVKDHVRMMFSSKIKLHGYRSYYRSYYDQISTVRRNLLESLVDYNSINCIIIQDDMFSSKHEEIQKLNILHSTTDHSVQIKEMIDESRVYSPNTPSLRSFTWNYDWVEEEKSQFRFNSNLKFLRGWVKQSSKAVKDIKFLNRSVLISYENYKRTDVPMAEENLNNLVDHFYWNYSGLEVSIILLFDRNIDVARLCHRYRQTRGKPFSQNILTVYDRFRNVADGIESCESLPKDRIDIESLKERLSWVTKGYVDCENEQEKAFKAIFFNQAEYEEKYDLARKFCLEAVEVDDSRFTSQEQLIVERTEDLKKGSSFIEKDKFCFSQN